ncbi:SAM-dependent MTase TRM10-type domain-containing protein [Aphelenchoides besseyi]|nr:SAM-dependent MTase TRM10-type domain-containing protein [Aphelenchoides besseyi]
MDELTNIFGELEFDSPKTSTSRQTKAEKVALRLAKMQATRLAKRPFERSRRKARIRQNGREKCKLQCTINVFIDMSFDSMMSKKERSHLVQQLCRVYGLQKKYEGLKTTICAPSTQILEECREKIVGFDNFNWTIVPSAVDELFVDERSIVLLSPDAENPPLETVDEDKCYVIGGLVDETGAGPQTKARNETLNCRTYRLPIQEYARKGTKGTFSLMLTLNQVVEILCQFVDTKSWPKALSAVVPKRTGYSFDVENDK